MLASNSSKSLRSRSAIESSSPTPSALSAPAAFAARAASATCERSRSPEMMRLNASSSARLDDVADQTVGRTVEALQAQLVVGLVVGRRGVERDARQRKRRDVALQTR